MSAPAPSAPVQVSVLDLPAMRRVGEIDLASRQAPAANTPDSRVVRLSVSSETPVARWFGNEVLDHAPGSVQLERLGNKAPLLDNHDPSRQIGVVERAWIDGKRLLADVRFSKSAEADALYQDVLDGIRSKISVGYRINATQLEKKEGDVKTYRATSWQPLEVSLVSIPADDSVGIGRNDPAAPETRSVPVFSNSPAPTMNETPAATAAPAPVAAVNQISVGRTAQSDAARILALGDTFGRQVEARAAVGTNKTFDQFITELETARANPVPQTPGTLPAGMSPVIGMSQREVKRFSLCRAIAAIANGGRVDGFEKEASDAFAKRFGLQNSERGFYVPFEVQTQFRDLGATSGPAGGVTVQTDVAGNELIELLRARLLVGVLGVRTMFGLQGNVSIPLVSAGATGAWLAEAAPITPSTQVFGQVPLTPKRYGAATAYSRQLVVQSSIDAEGFVRDDLAQTLSHALDAAVFIGPGTGGAPTGIFATSGIGTATFAAAATWAEVIAFETAVASANADYGSLAYVASPSTRGKWKAAPRTAGVGNTGYLWMDQGYIPVFPAVGQAATPGTPPIGVVNGYRAVASTVFNNTPTAGHRVLFGNFADAILATWIPLEVVVDPYSLALNHQVRVVANLLADVGVRHAASFVASVGAGNA